MSLYTPKARKMALHRSILVNVTRCMIVIDTGQPRKAMQTDDFDIKMPAEYEEFERQDNETLRARIRTR